MHRKPLILAGLGVVSAVLMAWFFGTIAGSGSGQAAAGMKGLLGVGVSVSASTSQNAAAANSTTNSTTGNNNTAPAAAPAPAPAPAAGGVRNGDCGPGEVIPAGGDGDIDDAGGPG